MSQKKYIKGTGVRIRSSPDTTNDHNIIEKPRENFEVTVLREENGWSEIEYAKRGWVRSDLLFSEPSAVSTLKFQCNPMESKELTQQFGEDPDLYSRWSLKGHHGLDFRTRSPDGSFNKKVRAVWDGKVIEATENDNNGRFVRLEHAGGAQTVYLHLDSYCVTVGQQVLAGAELGISGNTGFSGGPHLHFGYRPAGFDMNNGYKGYVDPEPLLS